MSNSSARERIEHVIVTCGLLIGVTAKLTVVAEGIIMNIQVRVHDS